MTIFCNVILRIVIDMSHLPLLIKQNRSNPKNYEHLARNTLYQSNLLAILQEILQPMPFQYYRMKLFLEMDCLRAVYNSYNTDSNWHTMNLLDNCMRMVQLMLLFHVYTSLSSSSIFQLFQFKTIFDCTIEWTRS